MDKDSATQNRWFQSEAGRHTYGVENKVCGRNTATGSHFTLRHSKNVVEEDGRAVAEEETYTYHSKKTPKKINAVRADNYNKNLLSIVAIIFALLLIMLMLYIYSNKSIFQQPHLRRIPNNPRQVSTDPYFE